MILAELAGTAAIPGQVMIGATRLKAHRTAANLFKRRPVPRRIGCAKGGLSAELHAVCKWAGCQLVLVLSEGQMIDFKRAALMIALFRIQSPARR